MSYLKLAPNLFLELQELNRWEKFFDEDGFRKALVKDSLSFGLIDGNENNFKVVAGSTSGTIKIKEGNAIDKFGKIIYKAEEDGILIPAFTGSNWYWVKIKHSYSPIEKGLVNISTNGTVTAPNSDSEFTKIYRGQPNFPSKIKFPNSVDNTQEYEVLSVIDDYNLIIQGDSFIAEEELTHANIGTFTTGEIIPSQDKYPFQYDSCIEFEVGVGLVLETVSNTAPTSLEDEEFFIARIRNSAGTLEIQDKRSNFWKTSAGYNLVSLPVSDENPVVGVEGVYWDNSYATQTQNIALIAWGFRSINFTLNSTLNLVSLLSGNGGAYKDTSDFSDGDFDGWRLYNNDGKYVTIINSIKNGTQIDLEVDFLDPIKFPPGEVLLVVPNAEEIIFYLNPGGGVTNVSRNDIIISYPINTITVSLPLAIFNAPSCIYNIRYRFKNHKIYTDFKAPVESLYYTEEAYDSEGTLVDILKTDTSNGAVTLQQKPTAYNNTGEVLGVQYSTISNDDPLLNLVVGTDKQFVILNGADFTQTDSIVINLQKTGLNLKNGSRFYIDFSQSIIAGAFTFQIRQDYEDIGTPGTLIQSLTAIEIKSKSLFLICNYDGSNWVITKLLKEDTSIYNILSLINTFSSEWSNYSPQTIGYNGGVGSEVEKNIRYQLYGKTIHINGFIKLKITNGTSINLSYLAGNLNIPYLGTNLRLQCNIIEVISNVVEYNNTGGIYFGISVQAGLNFTKLETGLTINFQNTSGVNSYTIFSFSITYEIA